MFGPQNGFANGSSVSYAYAEKDECPKAIGVLTEATQNVEAAVSRAEIIGNRVEQIADTVFGSPHPKATGTTNNAAQGVHFSQSESLRSATQRLFTVLDRLENEVSRLNAL